MLSIVAARTAATTTSDKMQASTPVASGLINFPPISAASAFKPAEQWRE
jgi:hypothetical protein